MKHYYTDLIIALTLFNGTFALSMHQRQPELLSIFHRKQFIEIIAKNNDFVRVVPTIKELGQTNNEWKQILSSSRSTGALISIASTFLQVTKAYIATMFTTPGAIKWGKKYISHNSQHKKNVEKILIDIARLDRTDLAWENQDLDVAAAILKMNISVNTTITDNKNSSATVLTTAAAHNKTDLITLLLNNNADIEIKNPCDNRTAVIMAAFHGSTEALFLLIARGAQVNVVDCYGNTALLYAVDKAKTKVAMILIGADAAVNVRSHAEETPLKRARLARFPAYKNEYQFIETMLIHAGAIE